MSKLSTITSILDHLAKSTDFLNNKTAIDESIGQLQFFLDHNIRYDYTDISDFIYNLGDQDIINLEENLKIIRESDIGESQEKILKFIDHISLSMLQKKYTDDKFDDIVKAFDSHLQIIKSRYEKLEKNYTNVADNIKEVQQAVDESLIETNESLQHSKRELDSIKDIKTQIITQFITILGIFTTIVFAGYGGLQLLSNILSNIDGPAGKIILLASLSFSGIISILFLLMTGISKIIGKNISSCGCKIEDKRCEHNFIQRYPLFALLQFISFVGSVIGSTSLFVNYHLLYEKLTKYIDVDKEITLILFILFISIAPTAFLFNKKFNKNREPIIPFIPNHLGEEENKNISIEREVSIPTSIPNQKEENLSG